MKQNNDAKLLKQIDERFNQLHLTTTRNLHVYEDRTSGKVNDVRGQTQVIKNQIE